MQGGAPGELRPDLSCERFTLFVWELGVHKLSGVHNVRGSCTNACLLFRPRHHLLCRRRHPLQTAAPGPLFSSTALRRLSEGLSTNSYGHREEGGARTIVAGQNSSGVALPKRQPKRADFCPISPATILP